MRSCVWHGADVCEMVMKVTSLDESGQDFVVYAWG